MRVWVLGLAGDCKGSFFLDAFRAYWICGSQGLKKFLLLNLGLKGVTEKCVGCFFVYSFKGSLFFPFSKKRYYGMRGLGFAIKLSQSAAKHTTIALIKNVSFDSGMLLN